MNKPTQRITFRQRADEHTRYAPTAFDNQVGKTIRFRVGDRACDATVVAVEVVEDGAAFDITVDVDDEQLVKIVASNFWHGEVKPDLSMSFRPLPAEDAADHPDHHEELRP